VRTLAVIVAGLPGGESAGRAASLRGFLLSRGLAPDRSCVFHIGEIPEPELLAMAPPGKTALVKINPGDLGAAAAFLAAMAPDLAITAAGAAGRELAGRLAARLSGSAALGVEDLDLSGERPKILKRAYGHNLAACAFLSRPPWCLSLAHDLPKGPPRPPSKRSGADRFDLSGVTPVKACLSPVPKGEGLAGAERLLVGGAGLGGLDGVELMAAVAEALGAKWGVSRSAALSGWAPMERLVGASGSAAAPPWGLALGGSGAAALYAGIAKAGLVASVNTDQNAPIAARSDLFAAAEAKAVLAEMARILKERAGEKPEPGAA
jgi:electron transfer flavoprotein alpha subunit